MHPMLFSRPSGAANFDALPSGTTPPTDPTDPTDPGGETGPIYGTPNTQDPAYLTATWPAMQTAGTTAGVQAQVAAQRAVVESAWYIMEGLGFHTPRTLIQGPNNPNGPVPNIGTLPVSTQTSFSTANQTIVGREFRGNLPSLFISAQNVTFEKCVFYNTPGQYPAGSASFINMGWNTNAKGLRFINCYFYAAESYNGTSDKSYNPSAFVNGGGGNSVSDFGKSFEGCVVRVNIGDSIKLANYDRVYNCYIETIRETNSAGGGIKHSDSLQASSRLHWDVQGNTIVCPNWPTGGGGNNVQFTADDNGVYATPAFGGVFRANLCCGGNQGPHVNGADEDPSYIEDCLIGPRSWTQYGTAWRYSNDATARSFITRAGHDNYRLVDGAAPVVQNP